jgi:hypothetical protein
MLPLAFGGIKNMRIRKHSSWEPIPVSDGGVFAAVSERPSWGGRCVYRDKNIVGYCDVTVHDTGHTRAVKLEVGNSFGGGGVAKHLAKGMLKALRAADPSLPGIGPGPSATDILKGSN